MAILHVKTPNGTTKDVNLETMNIESDLQQNGWCKLPNGLIIQWRQADVHGQEEIYLPISFTSDYYVGLFASRQTGFNTATTISAQAADLEQSVSKMWCTAYNNNTEAITIAGVFIILGK